MHSNKTDPLYNQEAGKRGEIYGRNSYPTILFNGGSIVRVGMSDEQIDAAINKEWSKKAQFSVQLEGKFAQGSNGKKIDFVSTVERLDDLANDKMKYAFIVFENDLDEGAHVFNHVVRLIEPSASGGSLRFGDESKKTVKKSIELNDEWIPENLGLTFVVWDADTLEVQGYSLWNLASLHLLNDFTNPVPAGKNLELQFDKELDSSAVGTQTVLLTNSSGDPINCSVKASGKKIIVEPTGGLVDGQDYTIWLLGSKNGIAASDKTTIDDNLILNFSAQTIKAPLMSIDTNSIAFGTINENASKPLTIENKGSDTLTGNITTGDPFVSTDVTDFSIDPGTSKVVTVKVDVKGLEESTKNSNIKIESNGGNAEIPVSFTYEKPAAKEPPVLDIGLVPQETYQETITISGKTTSGASLKCNTGSKEVSVAVDARGDFKVAINLVPGINKVVFVAEKDSLKIEKTVTIFRFVQILLQLDNKSMYVGDTEQTLASPPTASSPPLPKDIAGSTYMPIRPVAEALFATIAWDGATQKVTITQSTPDGKKKTIELWIGKKIAKINGVEQSLDAQKRLYPANVGGKTMLPLRFTANALGADVSYEAATKRITIKYPTR